MDAIRRMSGCNFVLVLAGILVAVSLASAKPYLKDVEIDVELQPVACFSRENNRTYAVGEKWGTAPSSGYGCSMITCTGPNSLSAVTCPTFVAPERCVEDPGDQTAVYPDCCPFPRCPEDSADVNTPKPTDSTWEAPVASNNIP